MIKRCLSMLMALCLLWTVPAASLAEAVDGAEIMAEAEIAAEPMEASVEATELELGESEGEADESEPPAQEAPAAEEAPVIEEASATEEAPAVEEAPAIEEAPAVEEAPVAQAVPAAEAAPALEAGVPEFVLTKNARHTVTMGDFLQLNLNGLTAKSFKSSKKKVATVTKTGLIAAVGGGVAKITVTISKKKKLTLTLTVVDPTMPTRVYLTRDGAAVSGTLTLNKGEPVTLVPVAAPEATAVTRFKWSTSSRKVVAVSGGVLTPKKVGTATVTVKTVRGGKKAKLKVKVIDPYKATAVYLDKAGLVYMTAGSTLRLNAAMTTASGAPSTSTLKWSTSNKKIATVNQAGLVTAKKKGTATITVKTSSGKKARVRIRVFARAGAATGMTGEWVSLEQDNTLNPGDLYTYVVSMKPLNATADVVWSTDNPGVVRVENTRRGDDLKFLAEVRAVDLGYATLTATDTVTGFTQSVKLYVKPGSEPTAISFPNLDNSPMAVGEKRDILYQVDPQDSLSHDANRAVVAYDTSVLRITYDANNAARNCRGTMDYKLHITAVGAGTTTVKVTLKNGVTNSFSITVR